MVTYRLLIIVINFYKNCSPILDELDGISLTFKDWRLNLRQSNTENVVRLNVETKKNKELLSEKVIEVSNCLREC